MDRWVRIALMAGAFLLSLYLAYAGTASLISEAVFVTARGVRAALTLGVPLLMCELLMVSAIRNILRGEDYKARSASRYERMSASEDRRDISWSVTILGFMTAVVCSVIFVAELRTGYHSGIMRFFAGCLACFLLVRILHGNWCTLVARRHEKEYHQENVGVGGHYRGGGSFQEWREDYVSGRSPFGDPPPPEKDWGPRSPFAQ